jgi:predicted DCC family thiol-disulfide oxidoreductase YuxK
MIVLRLAPSVPSEQRKTVGVALGSEKQQTWTVLYDAECGFCVWALSCLLAWDRAHCLRPTALQQVEAGHLLAGIQSAERMASWHLISPACTRYSGGAAVVQVLRLLPGGQMPAAVFTHFPKLTEKAYRWVADHRSQLSRLIPMTAKRNARRRVQEHVDGRAQARGEQT